MQLVHLAGIDFMIVAQQVEDPMYHQFADFPIFRNSPASGVSRGDLGSDDDVAEVL